VGTLQDYHRGSEGETPPIEAGYDNAHQPGGETGVVVVLRVVNQKRLVRTGGRLAKHVRYELDIHP
jgi:hypothetical protein